MEQRSHKLILAVAAILLGAGSGVRAEETPAPDTSAWACSKCTFAKGYASSAELGAGYLDESSAKFGDATGLDEDGVYVVANASGGVNLESGYRLDYELLDLGLDSRAASLEGGKQGSYDFGIWYDRIPHRIADTGETIFGGVGGSDLTLPSGWVRAGSTGGMTALGTSLRSVDVGYDRDRYGANGRYLLGEHWTFALDYKRDERSGTRPRLGSFGSVTSEMLRPVDDSTDRITADVRYQGKQWTARVGYFASIYDTKTADFTFDNPFNAFVAGGDRGQMALEPDNFYSEFSASVGWFGLPWNTAVTLSGAMGQGTQDSGLAPYTLNPNISVDALPWQDLDGEVSVTRADLSLSSRPLERLRLRGAASYDERDNDSRQAAFTSIVHTDLFPVVEDRINPVYGYERTRVNGSADYDVYDDLTVGVGGEWRHDRPHRHRGRGHRRGSARWLGPRAVASQRLPGDRAQGRRRGARARPVRCRRCGGLRPEPAAAQVQPGVPLPLVRRMVGNVAIGSLPLSLGVNVHYGDDSYMQSALGLVSGLDRRYGADLNWTVSENISAYASAGREKIDARTKGSSIFAAPDWTGEVKDDFETYGAGMNAKLSDRLGLTLDYTYADGDSNTALQGAGSGQFPTVKSELSSFKAAVTYGVNERADLRLAWWYETLKTSDWAYTPQPAALPTVLGLGIDPYNYDVNYVTLSLRYRFGGPPAAETAAE